MWDSRPAVRRAQPGSDIRCGFERPRLQAAPLIPRARSGRARLPVVQLRSEMILGFSP